MPSQSHLHSHSGTLLLSLEQLRLTNPGSSPLCIPVFAQARLGPVWGRKQDAGFWAQQSAWERPRTFGLCVFASEGSVTEWTLGYVCWVGQYFSQIHVSSEYQDVTSFGHMFIA